MCSKKLNQREGISVHSRHMFLAKPRISIYIHKYIFHKEAFLVAVRQADVDLLSKETEIAFYATKVNIFHPFLFRVKSIN